MLFKLPHKGRLIDYQSISNMIHIDFVSSAAGRSVTQPLHRLHTVQSTACAHNSNMKILNFGIPRFGQLIAINWYMPDVNPEYTSGVHTVYRPAVELRQILSAWLNWFKFKNSNLFFNRLRLQAFSRSSLQFIELQLRTLKKRHQESWRLTGKTSGLNLQAFQTANALPNQQTQFLLIISIDNAYLVNPID